MGSRLRIRVPDDFVLARDACSYGYFLLAPNHWDPATGALTRVFDLEEGPARIHITQQGWNPDFHPHPPVGPSASKGANLNPQKPRGPNKSKGAKLPPREPQGANPQETPTIPWPGRGQPLTARADRALSRPEQSQARRQIARMLRLDESAADIADFHRVDPRWRPSGRGRLFRSPTLFEDIVKTVTSCNVQWRGTIAMNERLCRVVGRRGAFPTARKMSRTRPTTLRARCGVGYRDKRLVELAKLFTQNPNRRPDVDPDWLEDPANPTEDIRRLLLDLPGIGPYAAANILQLLGRYDSVPLDTESVRHGKDVLGFTGTDAQIMKNVDAHFAPFGDHTFRSYWFELWVHYEARRGWAHTWKPWSEGLTP